MHGRHASDTHPQLAGGAGGLQVKSRGVSAGRGEVTTAKRSWQAVPRSSRFLMRIVPIEKMSAMYGCHAFYKVPKPAGVQPGGWQAPI